MIAETDETMRKGQMDVKRGEVEGGWEETGRRLGAEDSFVDRLHRRMPAILFGPNQRS